MGFRAEVSGLDDWREDWAHGHDELDENIRKVVSRGAVQIKKAWAARWTGYDHIPHLPRAINYDLDATPGGWEAEIGPDKNRKQGPLGSIVEFGTVHNAPIPGGVPALDAEAPRFEKAMGDVGEKFLGGKA